MTTTQSYPRRGSSGARAVLVAAATALAATPVGGGQAGAQESLPTADSTVVVLLGTGTPAPTPNRWGPATAIVVGTRVFLFDAGVGVGRRLAAAQLSTRGVTAAFITHLHSDHTLGLPELIFTSWVMGRERPFPIYGPPGLARMVDHIYAAWGEDIRIRTEGLEHHRPGGYRVDVHEVQPGVIYAQDGVRVRAFRVEHGAWKDAYGYRIDTPDRSIVISGDTRPSEELVRMATGVDVLLHEAQLPSAAAPSGRTDVDWPRYVSAYHTTSQQLGEIAARAHPRLLIVYHNRGQDAERILADIRRSVGGRVVFGEDLRRY